MTTPADLSTEFVKLGALSIELTRRGSGTPLLLLSGEEELERDSAVVADLAKDHEVLIPSPPGFGKSERPDWITNPDDFAYIYLDLIEKLGLSHTPVVGFSLGGWIAAEMAVKDDSYISRLALVDPYGVKLGGPFDRDIQDIWLLHPSKVAALKWRNLEKGKRDFTAMPDADLAIVAHNTESFARFCWDPYMHDPKLKHRLHRIKVPTLLIWGEEDGVTPVNYGRGYAELVPGARFKAIPEAGHYPHLEQPEAFIETLRNFIS